MKFKCTQCNESSTTEEWNLATYKVFGHNKEIVKIGRKDDSFHICPKCNEQLHSDYIVREKP